MDKIKISIIGILLISMLFVSGCTETTGQVIKPQCKDVQVPYEFQEEYLKTEYYTETSPYTDRECEAKRLSFKSSIDEIERITECTESHQVCKRTETNFWGTEKCVEWNTICDEYTQSCNFEVSNLDSESGVWTYKWSYTCGSSSDCKIIEGTNIDQSYSLYVEPTETKRSWAKIIYKPDYNAYCYAIFENVPNKEVCRDVIKYKEVQKERKVTAYRPITKYRTEQRCN